MFCDSREPWLTHTFKKTFFGIKIEKKITLGIGRSICFHMPSSWITVSGCFFKCKRLLGVLFGCCHFYHLLKLRFLLLEAFSMSGGYSKWKNPADGKRRRCRRNLQTVAHWRVGMTSEMSDDSSHTAQRVGSRGQEVRMLSPWGCQSLENEG